MSRAPQSLALYALTPAGAELARSLARAWPQARLFLRAGLAQPAAGEQAFERLSQALAANFAAFGGHVVFAAAGIVVRALSPLLRHKALDPAVVVADQEGRFAVSLLAGHLGGANDLAREVAAVLGGQAVITTATDAAGLPSLEVLSGELGMAVENLPALAGLSMALLEGRAVPVCDPGGWLWPALESAWPGRFRSVGEDQAASLVDEPLAWVGWRTLEAPPGWLVLRPACLALGLGCNRGTPADEMEDFLRRGLAEAGISPASLACLASVEAKRDEPGLLELARRLDLPCRFFGVDELAAAEAPNPSEVVAKHMGVASVCEAAALLAAGSRRLLMNKRKGPNTTMAAALMRPAGCSTS